MRLTIIVASCGRPTLARTLLSISPQMLPGDELLVSVNDDAPWGHAARNELMTRARGDALLFMDDDDQYTPDAFATIRSSLSAEPARMHIFRMRYPEGQTIWERPEVVEGQVSTQMVCVPNDPQRHGALTAPRWSERYQGDFDFISATAELLGNPVFHEEVIALCRP